MDNNYHINRNRKPLTPEDVQKGQNFDSFLQSYNAQAKPFVKSTTFYASVAAFGVIVAVGTYLLVTSAEESATPFVQPPLAGVTIADTAYTVDAQAGGNFIYNSGSVINVPSGAFLDSAGNPVSGTVQLHYREFHDPAAIFIAGIPMVYDSAGQRFHFESAGMLELTATLNGKQLKANPAQPIHIAMASNTPQDKFNIYYLDTVSKNWKFISRDKAAIASLIADTTQSDSSSAVIASVPVPPVMPRKAGKNRPGFAIKFDPAEFPELTVYKGVRFEVDENKTPYDKNDKKIEWEDVVVKRNRGNETYTVTFTKGEKTVSYVTYTVVDEVNYASAKKSFDQRYAEYQAALQKKNQDAAAKHRDLEKKLMNADARRIFVNDSVMTIAMSKRNALFANSSKEDMVMREFTIADFGFWNSDCPSSLPEGAEMIVRLIDGRTKKPMEVAHAYLVEKGRNAIFTYYNNDLAAFKFNPEADNMLWAITPDGKLAVFSADDFKKVPADKKQFDFEMEVQEQPLTATQAKGVLGI
jgi:hypothetical protein